MYIHMYVQQARNFSHKADSVVVIDHAPRTPIHTALDITDFAIIFRILLVF